MVGWAWGGGVQLEEDMGQWVEACGVWWIIVWNALEFTSISVLLGIYILPSDEAECHYLCSY